MGKRLYIGNFPFSTTENDLQDLFQQAGNVVSVQLIQDRATGKSRGFGFVELSTDDEANKAIEMFNGQDFQGRKMTVNEARPREERTGGGGGGGGGGRRDGGGWRGNRRDR